MLLWCDLGESGRAVHDAIDFRANEVGSGTLHATGGTKIHVAQHSTAMSQRERAARPSALLCSVRSQPAVHREARIAEIRHVAVEGRHLMDACGGKEHDAVVLGLDAREGARPVAVVEQQVPA